MSSKVNQRETPRLTHRGIGSISHKQKHSQKKSPQTTLCHYNNIKDFIEIFRPNQGRCQSTLSTGNRSDTMVSIATQTDTAASEMEDYDFSGVSEDNHVHDQLLLPYENDNLMKKTLCEILSTPPQHLRLTRRPICRGLDCNENCNTESMECPQDVEYEEVTLHKQNKLDTVGVVLNCKKTPVGDGAVFIEQIESNSIAGQDGQMEAGDQIIQINGMDVHSHDQAERLMTESTSFITFSLARSKSPQGMRNYKPLDGNQSDSGTDTMTGTPSPKHEKDSGLGRTDDSFRDSSEQELLDSDHCTSPSSTCQLGHDNSFDSFELEFQRSLDNYGPAPIEDGLYASSGTASSGTVNQAFDDQCLSKEMEALSASVNEGKSRVSALEAARCIAAGLPFPVASSADKNGIALSVDAEAKNKEHKQMSWSQNSQYKGLKFKTSNKNGDVSGKKNGKPDKNDKRPPVPQRSRDTKLSSEQSGKKTVHTQYPNSKDNSILKPPEKYLVKTQGDKKKSPDNTMAKSHNIEKEVAMLNEEIESIQINFKESLEKKYISDSKSPTDTAGKGISRPQRMVPRMGTRLSDKGKGTTSTLPPQTKPELPVADASKSSSTVVANAKTSGHSKNKKQTVKKDSSKVDPSLSLMSFLTGKKPPPISHIIHQPLPAIPEQYREYSDGNISDHTYAEIAEFIDRDPKRGRNSHVNALFSIEKYLLKEQKQKRYSLLKKSQSCSSLNESVSGESTHDMYSKCAEIMYTNSQNLAHTIKIQQELFQQQLKKNGKKGRKDSKKSHKSSSKEYVKDENSPGSNSGSNPESLPSPQQSESKGSVHSDKPRMEWVVKRRADGSRYITRRPVQSKKHMLKQRAKQLAEERSGCTTDDDAMSELKLGRYWNKEDRKRHLESARSRKKQKEAMMIMQMMNGKLKKKDTNIIENGIKKIPRHVKAATKRLNEQSKPNSATKTSNGIKKMEHSKATNGKLTPPGVSKIKDGGDKGTPMLSVITV